MGILDKLKGQFIDVIEWTDSSKDTMVYRFNKEGNEIMMGAQLTVRESQVVVMVNEGRFADVFGPGRYELSTQNMPILTMLKSWKYGFNSPFKTEIYFVNTRQFLDQKWGTSNPIMMRDPEFGMVRLRAHGIYSFSVINTESAVKTFLKEAIGTSAYFTVSGVTEHLKRMIVSGLSDAIAESKIPALDLAANYDELSEYALHKMNPKFEALGLRLNSFAIVNITLPEEVEKAMDRRTSMGVVGDLDKYTRFQAAEAMRDAAQNPNGAAGLGAGFGAAAVFSQAMQQSAQPQQPAPNAAPQAAPAASAADTKFCTECGSRIPRSAKFCPECGAKQ